MAPVAVCTPSLTDEFIHSLEIAIAENRQDFPSPSPNPLVRPYIRQRILKTRAIGRTIERNEQTLCILPFSHWTQNTLPNIFDIHHVSHETLVSQLEPWKKNLSSLATDIESPIQDLFPRVVKLGEIQKPKFPRKHDGFPMF